MQNLDNCIKSLIKSKYSKDRILSMPLQNFLNNITLNVNGKKNISIRNKYEKAIKYICRNKDLFKKLPKLSIKDLDILTTTVNEREEIEIYKKLASLDEDLLLPKPKYLKWQQVLKIFKPKQEQYKLIHFDDKIYTLSDRTILEVTKLLDEGINMIQEDVLAHHGSDAEIVYMLIKVNYEAVLISTITKEDMNKMFEKNKSKSIFKKGKKAGFFKYIHKMNHDLSRYQIFNKIEDGDYEDVCLIHALKMSDQLSDEEISLARTILLTEYVPMKKLTEITKRLKIKLEITELIIETEEEKIKKEELKIKNIKIINEFGSYILNKLKESKQLNNEQIESIKEVCEKKVKSTFEMLQTITEKLNFRICFCYGGNWDSCYVIGPRNNEKAKFDLEIDYIYSDNITNEKTDHSKNKHHYYGEEESTKIIKLVLADEHYMINDHKTFITSYAIKNYDEVKDIKEFNKIEKKRIKKDKLRYEKSNKKYISTLEMISLLLENKDKLLTKIEGELDNIITRRKLKETNFDVLEYDDKCVNKIEFKPKKNLNDPKINQVHFDIESTTDGDIHKGYLVVFYNIKDGMIINRKHFFGEQGVLKMFRTFNRETILFAHNLGGYDINFIFKHLIGDSIVERENKIFGGTSFFYNKKTGQTIKIHLKDTYLMLNNRLADCPDIFFTEEERKEIKKEIMPYGAYTEESVKKDYILIDEAVKHLKNPKDEKQFRENIKKWKCEIKKEYFDHMKYSLIYCEQDVNVQVKSYYVMRDWILKVTELDILDYMTISSIAYDFMNKYGCLEGCYNLSSIPAKFISKVVNGGRCMISENKKKHIIKTDDYKLIANKNDKEEYILTGIEDLDAASLYPSAMKRMSFVKGKPKVLSKDITYEEIKKYDGYYVEIKINKIGQNYNFPLMSTLSNEGVKMFENNLGTYYVDKTQLEDLINFQKIEFDIIKGYYFDEGVNDKIQEFMTNLFNVRTEEKKKGNKIEKVYKLLMNSCYGKLILKDTGKIIKYITGKNEAMKYICKNYEYVNYYVKIDDCEKYKVEEIKVVDDHFNAPHLGGSILSMSKRVMNEVMCLAESMGIKIYYQDTDSMHIELGQIKKLEEAYKSLYNRDLIGSNLGQFESDFEIIDENGKKMKPDKGTKIISIEAVFLGKKCYIDKLEIIINGEKEHHYHFRMKGVNSDTVEKYAKDHFNGDLMELYKHLYEGKSIKFNLLDTKVCFQKNKNMTIQNKDEFFREISF